MASFWLCRARNGNIDLLKDRTRNRQIRSVKSRSQSRRTRNGWVKSDGQRPTECGLGGAGEAKGRPKKPSGLCRPAVRRWAALRCGWAEHRPGSRVVDSSVIAAAGSVQRFGDLRAAGARSLFGAFQSGDGSLSNWLREDARGAAAAGSTRTYVRGHRQGRVRGFASLCAASASHGEASARMRQGCRTTRSGCPTGAAGVAASQGRGFGAFLVRDKLPSLEKKLSSCLGWALGPPRIADGEGLCT